MSQYNPNDFDGPPNPNAIKFPIKNQLETNKVSEKKWQKFESDCLNCGCQAEVLTDTGKDNWACDGDEARCPECGLSGGVNVYDEDEANISWHDEKDCDCSWCKQQKIVEDLRDQKYRLKELMQRMAIALTAYSDTSYGESVSPGIASSALAEYQKWKQNK